MTIHPHPIIIRTSAATSRSPSINASPSPYQNQTQNQSSRRERDRERERELPPLPPPSQTQTQTQTQPSSRRHSSSPTFHFYPQPHRIRIIPPYSSGSPVPGRRFQPFRLGTRRQPPSDSEHEHEHEYQYAPEPEFEPESEQEEYEYDYKYEKPRPPRIRIIIPPLTPSSKSSHPRVSSREREKHPFNPPPTPVPTRDTSTPSPSPLLLSPGPTRTAPTPPPTPNPDFSEAAPHSHATRPETYTHTTNTNTNNHPDSQTMSRYQEHFTPSQVSLASTQYRARERERERLLRSPAPPSVSSGGGRTTPGLQRPGLYGPSPPPGPPPRRPRHPLRTTIPAPLAPSMLGFQAGGAQPGQGQGQGQGQAQRAKVMTLNNVPPSDAISLNTPPPPDPPANPQQQQQQQQSQQQQDRLPPPPSIFLTSESRANSPILLRGTNGGVSPDRVEDSLKREREREERDKERERRERARMLVGLGRSSLGSPSPGRRGTGLGLGLGGGGIPPSPPVSPSRDDGPTAPQFRSSSPSQSMSRSIIPPALLPGGGIEIPTGLHITSRADEGRFRPSSADIRLGEPDLKNMIGKVVKGFRGLKAFGAFTKKGSKAVGGGGHRGAVPPGGFFDRRLEDVREEEFEGLVSPGAGSGGSGSRGRGRAFSAEPEEMRWGGGAPEGTPGAGPSTLPQAQNQYQTQTQTPTPRQTPPSPAPPPTNQNQNQNPNLLYPSRAQTPAPSEAPTFLTTGTGADIPTKEDLLLQDYMRRKRIMRDKAFKNRNAAGGGEQRKRYVPWATTSPPTILPPVSPAFNGRRQRQQPRRQMTGASGSGLPPPLPIPVPGNTPSPAPTPIPPTTDPDSTPNPFPDSQQPQPQTQIPTSHSQESFSASLPPTKSELDMLREAEEQREVDDIERERRRRARSAGVGGAGVGVGVPGPGGFGVEEDEEEVGGGDGIADGHLPTPTSLTQSPFIPPGPMPATALPGGGLGAPPSALRTHSQNPPFLEDADDASPRPGLRARFLPRSRRGQTPGPQGGIPYSSASFAQPAGAAYTYGSGLMSPDYSYTEFSGPTPPASRVFTRWTALVDRYGRRVANPYYRDSRSRSRSASRSRSRDRVGAALGSVPFLNGNANTNNINTTATRPQHQHQHPRPSSILSYSSPLGGFFRLWKQILHMPWVGDRVVADIVPGGIRGKGWRKKGYYADGGVMSESVTITGVGSDDLGSEGGFSEGMSDGMSEGMSEDGDEGSGTAIPYPRAGAGGRREYESIASRLYDSQTQTQTQTAYIPQAPSRSRRGRRRLFKFGFAPRSKPGKSWYSRPGERFMEWERARERRRAGAGGSVWGGGPPGPGWGGAESYVSDSGTGLAFPVPFVPGHGSRPYYSARATTTSRRRRHGGGTESATPRGPPNPLPPVPSMTRLREMRRRLNEEREREAAAGTVSGDATGTGVATGTGTAVPESLRPGGRDEHGHEHHESQSGNPSAGPLPDNRTPLSPTPTGDDRREEFDEDEDGYDDRNTLQPEYDPTSEFDPNSEFIDPNQGEHEMMAFSNRDYDFITLPSGQPPPAGFIPFPYAIPEDAKPVVIPVRYADDVSGSGADGNGNGSGRRGNGFGRRDRTYRNVGRRRFERDDDTQTQTATQTYTQSRTQTQTQTGTHLQPPTATNAPSGTTATGNASYIFIPRSDGPRRREGGYEYVYDRIRVPRSGPLRERRRAEWISAA